MNKTMTTAQVVAQLRDGMTIGIGGWGPRRKPMAIVREILRSPLKDLTIVAYGGPEVGMLCAAGKVKKLVYGFATLDAIPLEPWYRKARENGSLELMEVDEGMFEWGLRAAGMRLLKGAETAFFGRHPKKEKPFSDRWMNVGILSGFILQGGEWTCAK